MPAAPGAAEALLVVLRWLHALAAIVFLGWSAVLWLDGGSSPAQRYKEITEVTLLIFLATGAILTFDRLSHGAGGTYAAVLALKVTLGAVAYQYAFRWRRRGLAVSAPDGRIVLISGAGAVLLAAVLKGVFESGLVGSTL